MIITISGQIGSGKSTVAKFIADKYSLRYFSTGQLFRALAKEKSMDLQTFSKLAETDPTFDNDIDQRQKDAAKEGNIVFDGRLGGWIIDQADIRVYISCDFDERAKRVAGRDKVPVEQAKAKLVKRENSEAKRYKEYYGIDIKDESIYDIKINSTLWSANGVQNIISEAIKEWKSEQSV